MHQRKVDNKMIPIVITQMAIIIVCVLIIMHNDE